MGDNYNWFPFFSISALSKALSIQDVIVREAPVSEQSLLLKESTGSDSIDESKTVQMRRKDLIWPGQDVKRMTALCLIPVRTSDSLFDGAWFAMDGHQVKSVRGVEYDERNIITDENIELVVRSLLSKEVTGNSIEELLT